MKGAISVTYNFRFKSGSVLLKEGEQPDREACIALFQAIDPAVWQIVVNTAGISTAIYSRSGSGWFTGSVPRPRRRTT
jgi:hypothetical protein